MFDTEGENRSTFSFKTFAGMSNEGDALLIPNPFNSFSASSSVAVLKMKQFLHFFKNKDFHTIKDIFFETT